MRGSGGRACRPRSAALPAAAAGRTPRPGRRLSAGRRRLRPAPQAALALPLPSGSAPRRLQMADKMAAGQLTTGAPARRPAPGSPASRESPAPPPPGHHVSLATPAAQWKRGQRPRRPLSRAPSAQGSSLSLVRTSITPPTSSFRVLTTPPRSAFPAPPLNEVTAVGGVCCGRGSHVELLRQVPGKESRSAFSESQRGHCSRISAAGAAVSGCWVSCVSHTQNPVIWAGQELACPHGETEARSWTCNVVFIPRTVVGACWAPGTSGRGLQAGSGTRGALRRHRREREDASRKRG